MKTVIDSIEEVMRISEEYEQLTGRQRGISDYIWERLPVDGKVAKRYILLLRHYGKNLKIRGVWEKAKIEQWDTQRIQSFIRRSDRLETK